LWTWAEAAFLQSLVIHFYLWRHWNQLEFFNECLVWIATRKWLTYVTPAAQPNWSEGRTSLAELTLTWPNPGHCSEFALRCWQSFTNGSAYLPLFGCSLLVVFEIGLNEYLKCTPTETEGFHTLFTRCKWTQIQRKPFSQRNIMAEVARERSAWLTPSRFWPLNLAALRTRLLQH
jgi:hypothetical protein